MTQAANYLHQIGPRPAVSDTQSRYLTARELAEMIDCGPSSFACMRRHLQRHGVPFIPNLRGFPQVDRRYYDARMSGTAPAVEAKPADMEPDFSAI